MVSSVDAAALDQGAGWMVAMDVSKLRNIGISAHIDSGKTTLTERILFYTQRIRLMHDVRGSDGVGAKMDSMELERERGITIASAATHCVWAKHHINIIDTPGHVDFTIEVERALRVLDGAVLLLCAVSGVQSQSLTVDRQMRRYKVPRLVFVNKCDRVGANPTRVIEQMREKLSLNPVALQLPLGLEDKHQGVIDLIDMQTISFEGPDGAQVTRGPIPADRQEEADQAREQMLDKVSMFSDELTEAILDDEVSPEQIRRAVRIATCERKLVPVLMGSAYRNRGVQELLDAVVNYLPAPEEVVNKAESLDPDHLGETIELSGQIDQPTVALAFKLEDSRFGQLTYLRLYDGQLRRKDTMVNVRNQKKHRIGRLVRMHADEMEDIQEANAGDIVAMFGVDCRSGDTFTDGRVLCSLSPMHVPLPVISLSIQAPTSTQNDALAKAITRFTKEDPTFSYTVDAESSDTLIHGMGELHLDVYIERIKREYGVTLQVSAPRVAYREAISKKVVFNTTHKKQTGGAGQFARVAGYIEPTTETDFEFVDKIKGGAIPSNYLTAVEKGFIQAQQKGPLLGAPLIHVRVVVNDGATHAVDSSEMAFLTAAKSAWRDAVVTAKVRLLEPIMRVAVEGPAEFTGSVLATLNQRRGAVGGCQEENGQSLIEAQVPLANMFGYATALRSATEGKSSFTMELARYLPVPTAIQEELVEKARQARLAKESKS